MSGEINSTRENLLAVAEAVKAMADMLNESEGATAAMSCSEVNSIVRVLAVAGHRDEAANLIIGHALGGSEPDYYNPDGNPEDNDAHGFLTAMLDDEQGIGTAEQFDAAWRYVKAMVDEPGGDEHAACRYVLDGHDTDGTPWHRCETHDKLSISPDYPCEGWKRVPDEYDAIEELLTGDPWKPTVRMAYDHDARPDDDPEPGDRCKVCGKAITWMGPSPTSDWKHSA